MNQPINEINERQIKQRQQRTNHIFKIKQFRFLDKNTNAPQNRYTKNDKTKHRKNVKNNAKILIQRTKKCIVQTHTLGKYFF